MKAFRPTELYSTTLKPPKTSQSHEQPTLDPPHHRSVVKPCQHFPLATTKNVCIPTHKTYTTHTAAISISLLLPLLPPLSRCAARLTQPHYIANQENQSTYHHHQHHLRHRHSSNAGVHSAAPPSPTRRTLLVDCMLACCGGTMMLCCVLDVPCMSVCLRWDACMHAPRSLPSRRMCVWCVWLCVRFGCCCALDFLPRTRLEEDGCLGDRRSEARGCAAFVL
jgi:hypothetical protein